MCASPGQDELELYGGLELVYDGCTIHLFSSYVFVYLSKCIAWFIHIKWLTKKQMCVIIYHSLE